MPALRLVDLFAGAGGMSLGFAGNGLFSVSHAVEIDRAAAATYKLNHMDSNVFVGDVKSWLAGADGEEADVVIGGPPCQGFSALGKRDALDERNRLWRDYGRAIQLLRPKYFVLENVAQFLDSPQFGALRRWTHSGGPLADYALQPMVLNAADYGAHQSRRRAVVLGRLRSLPKLRLPTGEFAGRWRTVREAFDEVEPKVTSTALPNRRLEFDGRTLHGYYTSRELHVSRHYEQISLDRFSHIPAGGNRFDLPEPLKARCWTTHHSGSADVMGRLRWDSPSVTIRTEFFKPEKGRYLHPTEPRAITHYEATLLQGFPPDYRWAGSKAAIARQIGNAVPIQLSRALGDLIASSPFV